MGTTGLPSADHTGGPPLSHFAARARRVAGGMTTAEIEDLNVRLGRLDDWYAICQNCGTKLKGRLSQLSAHVCEVQDGT